MDKNIDLLIKQTKWFIEVDPTVVEFRTISKQRKPGGGSIKVEGATRAPETVKVIWPGGVTSGIFTNFDGESVQYDMIIVAMPDSPMEVGDFWELNGVRYVIEGFAPDNFYEKKAALKVYGAGPIGG